MRQRKAILHIGTAKTGSTTIQRLLAQNRQELLARGFAYPTSPGARNHFRLAIAGADPEAGNNMAWIIGEAGDAAAVACRFKQELADELETMPDSVRTVIFSNEHCYIKIGSAEAAARLRDFLAPFFGEFRIVVYLRRQDEMAVSRYTTRLRAGGVETRILPQAGAARDDDEADEEAAGEDGVEWAGRLARSPSQQNYDWAAMLDRWATAFGREAVCPRVFARDAFTGGDLMLDFQDACGMADVFEPGAPAQNSSLLPAAQEFLRHFNVVRREGRARGGSSPQLPGGIKRVMSQNYSGAGRRPARADAEAYCAAFSESNERLRSSYFADRDRVFSADFSKYPVQEDPLPSDAEVLKVALAVLLCDAEDAPLRAADDKVRRGRSLLGAGDTAKAAHSFRRALAVMPTHAAARAALDALGETDTPTAPVGVPMGVPMGEAAAQRRRQEKRRAERLHDAAAASGTTAGLPAGVPANTTPNNAENPQRPDLTPEERAARRARRAEREKRQPGKAAAV